MERQEQLEELKKAMKETDNTLLYKRYQAVSLYLSGKYTQQEVADIVGFTRKTVYTHVNTYLTEGLAALKPNYGKGRPRKLTKEQEEELANIVAYKLPSDVGLGHFANWTEDLAIRYTEKTWGVSFKTRSMGVILKRQGLSYTRPTYTLAKADPEKQRVFREEVFPLLKKN